MKRLLKFLLILSAPAVVFGVSGPVVVANETGISYNNTYPVNLNGSTTGGNKFAAQVTSSSDNVTAQTFIDGQQSTATITVASNNILAVAASNKITVPPTSQILAQSATAQITISSCVPSATVFVNGNTLIEGRQWNCGASTATAALSLATAMNSYIGALVSTNVLGVIYTTATVAGSAGNSFTITTSSVPAFSTTTFSGGSDPILRGDVITFNGNAYPNDYQWTDNSGTSNGTAQSIAALLNSFGIVVATVPGNGSVIYTTATVANNAGNLFTLSASTPGLVIATPNYAGGQDNGSVTINGITFMAGVNFSTGTTAQTATSLAAAINTATLDGTGASVSGSVVTTSSTAVGLNTNYILASSTQAALTLSAPFVITNGASTGIMTGGKDSAYTINSATITLPNHGLSKAMPVLYSGTPAIGGLTTGTTYYVVPFSANAIQLSSTSAVAQTGVGIVLTSSSTQTSAHTYTLSPLAFTAGSAAGFWQASNDGVNWATFTTTAGSTTVNSQSFTATSTTVVQDFGIVDYGYLRYNVTAPTTGGLALKVILNAKD